jgi:hypothetical protein
MLIGDFPRQFSWDELIPIWKGAHYRACCLQPRQTRFDGSAAAGACGNQAPD